MKTRWMGTLGLAVLWASAAATGCVAPGPDDGDDPGEGLGGEVVAESAQAFTASAGGPVCTLSVDKTTGPAPLSVKLTASCADPNGDAITAYYLVCGNGQSQFGAGKTLTCNYTAAGSYSPFVQAMDATGAWGSAAYRSVTATSSVHAVPEAWSATPSGLATKCAVVYADGTGSYSTGGSVTSYQWNIDGTSYTGSTASKTFCNYHGFIMVSLTVTDSIGNTDTGVQDVYICPPWYRNRGDCSALELE